MRPQDRRSPDGDTERRQYDTAGRERHAGFLMLMRAVGHASPEIHRRVGDIRVVFWSLEAESVCLYTEEWLLSQPCTPLSLISL